MILTTTTQKLQVFLAGAITTSNCPINIDYVDFDATTTTPGMTSVNTNGTATVDILAAPAASTQRKVNGITLFNADTAAVVVTIQINDNATLYQLVSAMTIPVGATLQYTDRRGWSVMVPGGGIKSTKPVLNTQTSFVQAFTSNGTWTKPASARFVMVECVGGGGGGGGAPGGGYNARGGGGGGGKRNRFTFLAKDLPSTVSITVAATASGGAANTNGTDGNFSSFGTYLYGYGGGAGGGTPGGAGVGGGGPGGGGGGGTSAGSGRVGGSAFAVSTTASNAGLGYAEAIGAYAGLGAAYNDGGRVGPGSYLGGGAGGSGSGGGSGTSIASGAGGYSWFSAGGGGGGNGGAGGGAGSTLTGPASGAGTTDTLGCGTGGAGNGAGGFPGGGGGGGTSGAGSSGAAGVVRVWCW